jgi:hypothetical protein
MQQDDPLASAHIVAARASSDALESDLRWSEQPRVAWEGDSPRVGIFFSDKRSTLVAWLLAAVIAAGLIWGGLYVLDVSSHRSEITGAHGH